MNAASHFRDAPGMAPRSIRMSLDGETLLARPGETVAAALLAQSGDATRRTPVTGAGRTAFCMMGVCFDCLVTIDGRPNVQACMTPARDGMVIRRQIGARRLGDQP
ncbi:(2Fe-2S)-binding protein [Paracoccus lutimaris]|uniref:2Fe-2S iron-sulfur cluster protein n=1 Tax=Paracoccus lutimaris TaxID=1490030 RepID=A0A368YHU7_9RHOB|nr:(2Fe-2S)-binding protein [Paracoccus lutimaris]RCW79048.1 2Fe-2S iron-sulfur cluster protein [Paracoccus lutimaris]